MQNILGPELKQIFGEALDQRDGPERAAYLDRACVDNQHLRNRVEALLKFTRRTSDPTQLLPGCERPVAEAADFTFNRTELDFRVTKLKTPGAVAAAPTPPCRPAVVMVGDSIGPYKLIEQIGEGGMGTVYLAEQERPIRRQVALKVIKPGMDTDQVIARFEAERQALAMMDHPNIARVLDVGATVTGRPYFVMELVQGISITEYCDQNHLTTRERLALFIPVCRAIQHAHQKGIIHRDIKPSNVLVTCRDGVAEPKVIDFGVAKAIEQSLTEESICTEFGAIIGTLEYMSPEQADLGGIDIDTRSDIYSLGVLLYELLTGSTPLERRRLRAVTYSELLRQIREDAPPRPSSRLGEVVVDSTMVSDRRSVEPARLARLLRGDLDWIVMKSLDKDRSRRYETANGFARDIQRHLDGDPVEACPPSTVYKLRKFTGRHRGALATATLIACMLITSTIVSAGLAYWANLERIRAVVAERHADMLRQAAQIHARATDPDQDRSDSGNAQPARPTDDKGVIGRDWHEDSCLIYEPAQPSDHPAF